MRERALALGNYELRHAAWRTRPHSLVHMQQVSNRRENGRRISEGVATSRLRLAAFPATWIWTESVLSVVYLASAPLISLEPTSRGGDRQGEGEGEGGLQLCDTLLKPLHYPPIMDGRAHGLDGRDGSGSPLHLGQGWE